MEILRNINKNIIDITNANNDIDTGLLKDNIKLYFDNISDKENINNKKREKYYENYENKRVEQNINYDNWLREKTDLMETFKLDKTKTALHNYLKLKPPKYNDKLNLYSYLDIIIDDEKVINMPKQQNIQTIKPKVLPRKADKCPESKKKECKDKGKKCNPDSGRCIKDDKPKDDKPEDDKPEDDKPKDDKPVDDKPKDDKPEDDKPKDDKPVDDKPVDDKPKDDKPKDDKPKDDKPKDDKPKDDKPEDDKPEDDKPKDDKPEDDKCTEAKKKECKDKGKICNPESGRCIKEPVVKTTGKKVAPVPKVAPVVAPVAPVPKVAPVVAPVVPNVAPKVAPKVAPVVPKVAPKVAPVEPKVAPVEPKVVPKVAPVVKLDKCSEDKKKECEIKGKKCNPDSGRCIKK